MSRFSHSKAELEVIRVLRQGGALPELRNLRLGDATLLATLRNLERLGVVDSRGHLIPNTQPQPEGALT